MESEAVGLYVDVSRAVLGVPSSEKRPQLGLEILSREKVGLPKPKKYPHKYIYHLTHRWFYITWIVYVIPFVSGLTTVTFLGISGILWYNFLKAWKGDPGIVNATPDVQMKTIIQLAEKGAEKGRVIIWTGIYHGGKYF